MVLPPGDYRIKYLGVGPPLYATSNGPHRIVTTARGSPGVVERQIWKVVTRGPGYVIEVQQHPNDGWFYNEPDKYQPIILDDQEASEFTIESAGDPAHPDVYFIKPVQKPNPPLGVDYLVDAEDRNVVIKPYVVGPGPLPKWQFILWVQE